MLSKLAVRPISAPPGSRPAVAHAVVALGLAVALLAGLSACTSIPTFKADDRPRKTVLKIDGFEVHSDQPITRKDSLIAELAELRVRVSHKLRLDPGPRPVVIYLFGDETRYSTYMAEHFPGLPPRRAFFVGSPGELGVYAFLGANIEADLRHEATHGLLHSSLGEVPLWLDEGLAEYFETPATDPRRVNTEHARRLALALRNGWTPNLRRLEQLSTVADMQRADYQEAWAWVHFLMHESTVGRDVLLEYLHDLPNVAEPTPLSQTIAETFPAAEHRLTAYVGTLQVR